MIDCSTSKKNSSRHNFKKRTFRDIIRMIKQSDLSANVKKISLDIFSCLAQAEGKIHGQNMDDVHFHEVGAIDSIVDIVGGGNLSGLFKSR